MTVPAEIILVVLHFFNFNFFNFGLHNLQSVCTNRTIFLPLMQNLMESLLKFKVELKIFINCVHKACPIMYFVSFRKGAMQNSYICINLPCQKHHGTAIHISLHYYDTLEYFLQSMYESDDTIFLDMYQNIAMVIPGFSHNT